MRTAAVLTALAPVTLALVFFTPNGGANVAAANLYAPADSAFAGSDGIAVPDAANQSPGQQRREHSREREEIVIPSGVRLSKLIGEGVFAVNNQRLGTVRDVMLHAGSEPVVVLRANGRTVALGWDRFAFGQPHSLLHGKVLLPGQTARALDELPAFKPDRARSSG